ncbi:porin [Alphaproteobacteria bacterium]|nr:porin [Alphaproteobacteria bacterium]
MRKLLLGTTALAAAATISANVAVADVSISGYYEWKYQSTSSDITANDGTTFGNDSEIKFSFSNKTDSGLTLGLVTEMLADAGDTEIDEASLSISGGFGKIVLGQNDGVGDSYGVASTDLPAEEIYAGVGTDNDLVLVNADMNGLSGDANKVSYHLPAMGGLSAGVSFMNSGAAGSADSTEFGAQYAMDAGGASITIGFATGSTEASSQDTDTQVMGVKVSSGNITAAVSQSTYEAAARAAVAGTASSTTKARVAPITAMDKADEESTGAAVSFKVNDGMTVTVHTAETDDGQTTESYSNSGIEIAYTVAPGLSAYLNVEDYDYKAGTSTGNTDNAGTASKLTIKATF